MSKESSLQIMFSCRSYTWEITGKSTTLHHTVLHCTTLLHGTSPRSCFPDPVRTRPGKKSRCLGPG